MFYVKTKIGCSTIETEIDGENLFTRCPQCGKEILVETEDLKSIFENGGDLCSTTMDCPECSEKRLYEIAEETKRQG